ncbi:MAG: D-TA family PLP-dependent enzyme [Acidimicrobiia bacterium]|nr:D-TA family PLP-dependent enzyme [Acidimicrobiia bacterium]
MRVSELDTPALLIDLDIMEANLKRVAEYAAAHDLRLRPHTKTHKTIDIGRRQLVSGAAGLTVAKVSEAEVMVKTETPDLLVAYPVIGRGKLDRLAQLARSTQVTVAVDHLMAARQLSDAARQARVEFHVLAEVDVGLGRVGVQPAEAVDFARSVSNLAHLKFDGIAFYPGHIKLMDEAGQAAVDKLSDTVSGMVKQFRAASIPANIVSGGSTPTLYESHRIAGMNEIRPGTYIFNDRNTVECGSCKWEECAASILVTVVSTAKKGQMIIDGGSKTFSSDRLATTGEPTFGLIREAPGASFHRMMEEHGFVDLRRAERSDFQVGDRVQIVPNHICVAVNLHERIYGVRGGVVEQTWDVEARGKLQ